MQSFLFSFGTNGIVKVDSLSYGLLRCERARAQRFKFTNVSALRFVAGKQRPRFFNEVFLHIHHPGTKRSAQPLVQAGAEVIAIKIRNFIIEMGKGVSGIHDTDNTTFAGFSAKFRCGKNLSGPGQQVGDMPDFGFGCGGVDRQR